MTAEGNLIDINKREIYPARLNMRGGIIESIVSIKEKAEGFILPGLIDAHIHIESSMTTPGSFAGAAVSRGTTGVICDPHEIANVLGIGGVKFMIDDSKKVPLKFWFGAPSCVPATSFETSGAVIDHNSVKELLEMHEIKYLSEVMNYQGVVFNDPEVYEKINLAKKLGKPIDGHAPGLSGKNLRKYIQAGITTDHECSTIEEALEKISLGMKILIREGSAARNLSALKPLINSHPDMVMLCSDDLHPEMLMRRHINKIVGQLISEGFDIFDVIKSCSLNPARHYNLDSGLLQPGKPADFIIVKDYHNMDILETWIDGIKIYDRGKVLFNYEGADATNKFFCSKITELDIRIEKAKTKMRVIEAFDCELLTKEISVSTQPGKPVIQDVNSDTLKIIVKDRYNDAPPAVGFIRGFGLKQGAFASSVAHDSHNIICIGTNDKDIVNAVNAIVEMQGGLAVAENNSISRLPLPVAGIMSDQPLETIASLYERLSAKVTSLGCKMSAPFMTLSFMALLVIPELKLSDRGLFDGKHFCHVPLFIS